MFSQRYGSVEWEPIRSKLTGNQLAANVPERLDMIQGEITHREKLLEELLAS